MRGHIRFGILALSFVAPFAVVMPAAAQTTDVGKWEIEVHGGGVWPTNPAGGSAGLPGPGQVFATATTMPTPAPSSRRESSWYFGDGAVLFNQAVASLFTQATNPAIPPRIAALDSVLGSSLGVRKPAGSIGISVSRALTRRLSAEFRADYSRARLQITESNSDAIEATRATFITAWEGLIRFNPNRVLNSVTSTAALENGSGHQLLTSGALIINLRSAGNVIPYAAVGGGLIATSGEMPTTTLLGNYQFRLGAGGAPINETDSVTVSAARDGHTFAGILGGGVKYFVSARWGIRFDVRAAIGKNGVGTSLNAAPSVADLRPSGRGVLNAEPTIQFSNNSIDPVNAAGVTAVAASTLTGPTITDFRTFSGSGVVSYTNVVTGIFWRF